MKVKNDALYSKFEKELEAFVKDNGKLPGILNLSARDAFIRQLIDSVRRVKCVLKIADRKVSENIASPRGNVFDPLKAAVHHRNTGNLDEAAWVIFLATHFGKSPSCNWLLTKDIYGRLGEDPYWSWDIVIGDLAGLVSWCVNIKMRIDSLEPRRKFGNHRKYESLKHDAPRPLSKVISSYVNLITENGGCDQFFGATLNRYDNCRYRSFDYLYKTFGAVSSFGRTARFDYLCMLGKLGIVDIEPPKTYMSGATGPVSGAYLLFGKKNISGVRQLERALYLLSERISINPFGMQVLEDALCNWQKDPGKYVHFGG